MNAPLRRGRIASATESRSPRAPEPLEERIRQIATDLLMREGYNGTSFLAIAKELGITHSNVHYYFKTKAALAEAVVGRYADGMLATYRGIWTDPGTDLFTKFVQTRDWAWSSYLRYNPSGSGAAHWGLLHRLTLDSEALSPELKLLLRNTTGQLEGFVAQGIATAVDRGELAETAPRPDLVLHVSTLLYSSRQATRYEGSFERLDRLFRATADLILRAYGTGAGWPEWPAPSPAAKNTGPKPPARKDSAAV